MEKNKQHYRALADHLRGIRTVKGLSLQELSEKSGVSRATLSRIENADVSPTAETLGRLAAAFALPLSQLLTPLEEVFQPLIRRSEQRLWTDPEKGFKRRAVSPPSGQLKLEIIECTIEPYQCINYDAPAILGHEHHLMLLEGMLTLTIENVRYELQPGDCLRYQLRGTSSFQTDINSAHYIISMA